MLLAGAGQGDREIARALGIGRIQVARWRARFAEGGVAAIEADLPCSGRKARVDAAEIVRVTTQKAPEGATHWSTRDVLNGHVIGQCQQRHTHVEWMKFLRQIDRETPKDKTLHLIADNYATHKHPKAQAWLAKHPRFHMQFTPTSASWLNMVD